ncbi:hypothetical protein DL95DRAFT_395192, partial [Leptodontidium sp. 2 PMI_412]
MLLVSKCTKKNRPLGLSHEGAQSVDQFATIIAVIVAILTMNIVLGLAWQLLEYVWRASLK